MNKNVKTLENITSVAKTYYKIKTIKNILTFILIGFAIFKVINIIFIQSKKSA